MQLRCLVTLWKRSIFCLVAVLMRDLCCRVHLRVRRLLLHTLAWLRCLPLHIPTGSRRELFQLTTTGVVTSGVPARLRIADFSRPGDDNRLILHILLLQCFDTPKLSISAFSIRGVRWPCGMLCMKSCTGILSIYPFAGAIWLCILPMSSLPVACFSTEYPEPRGMAINCLAVSLAVHTPSRNCEDGTDK